MSIPFIDTQNTLPIQNVTQNLINSITHDNINDIFNEINSTHATITQKNYFTNLLYTFFQDSSLPMQLDLLSCVITAIPFNSIHVEFDVALLLLQKIINNPVFENILVQAIQQVNDNNYESFQYFQYIIDYLNENAKLHELNTRMKEINIKFENINVHFVIEPPKINLTKN